MNRVRGFRIFAVGMAVAAASMLLTVGNGQTPQEQLKAIRSGVTDTVNGRVYYIHTIRRGQTLYMISKAYGVDVNDLIAENPQVKNGIRADEKLRIPAPLKTGAKGGAKSETPRTPQEKQAKSQTAEARPEKGPADKKTADTVAVRILPCGSDTTLAHRTYRVALMLPLYLGDAENIIIDPKAPEPEEPYRSFQFISFYEGFQMAIDSLVRSGMRIKLWVYDVDKDTVKTRSILKQPELASMDLIVGLLYTRNFQIVAEFARKNRIAIVNPISERSDVVSGNPYVFKSRPSKRSRMDQLASYMAENFYRGQVLVLKGAQFKERDLPEQLRKECQERKLNLSVVDNQENLITRLSKERENYVVVFADNASYVLELTRRLFELRNEYLITLVGLTDWMSLEGLEPEYLVALHTHVMAPSFVDYDVPRVRAFVKRYYETRKGDPDLLAFQGYDNGIYFLSALRKFGPDLQRCIGEFSIRALQNGFSMGRDAKGNGFENRHWPVIKYENYRLTGVH